MFLVSSSLFVIMGSTVFITYVKWSNIGKERGRDFFFNIWMKKHENLCVQFNIKFLKWGLPLGTEEDHVFLYETKTDVHNFMEFKGKVSNIDNEKLWDYSKTNIIVCPD